MRFEVSLASVARVQLQTRDVDGRAQHGAHDGVRISNLVLDAPVFVIPEERFDVRPTSKLANRDREMGHLRQLHVNARLLGLMLAAPASHASVRGLAEVRLGVPNAHLLPPLGREKRIELLASLVALEEADGVFLTALPRARESAFSLQSSPPDCHSASVRVGTPHVIVV